jgi:hypothetical protein
MRTPFLLACLIFSGTAMADDYPVALTSAYVLRTAPARGIIAAVRLDVHRRHADGSFDLPGSLILPDQAGTIQDLRLSADRIFVRQSFAATLVDVSDPGDPKVLEQVVTTAQPLDMAGKTPAWCVPDRLPEGMPATILEIGPWREQLTSSFPIKHEGGQVWGALLKRTDRETGAVIAEWLVSEELVTRMDSPPSPSASIEINDVSMVPFTPRCRLAERTEDHHSEGVYQFQEYKPDPEAPPVPIPLADVPDDLVREWARFLVTDFELLGRGRGDYSGPPGRLAEIRSFAGVSVRRASRLTQPGGSAGLIEISASSDVAAVDGSDLARIESRLTGILALTENGRPRSVLLSWVGADREDENRRLADILYVTQTDEDPDWEIILIDSRYAGEDALRLDPEPDGTFTVTSVFGEHWD